MLINISYQLGVKELYPELYQTFLVDVACLKDTVNLKEGLPIYFRIVACNVNT